MPILMKIYYVINNEDNVYHFFLSKIVHKHIKNYIRTQLITQFPQMSTATEHKSHTNYSFARFTAIPTTTTMQVLELYNVNV